MRYLLLNFLLSILALNQSCYAYYKFVVIANAFNNKNYYKQHIDSIAQQDYPYFRVVYCDDCSSDGSGALARNYIATLPNRHLFTFVQNSIRRGQLANTYDAIHSAQDEEVVVIVDADDMLTDKRALAYLDFIYSKKKLWMSYGQFKFITSDRRDHRYNKTGFAVPYPSAVINNRSFRHYHSYLLSHPRTYYAWLFKRIKLEDLLYDNYFYLAATDPATMFPMAEMAVDHLAALDKVLYAYTYHGGPSKAQTSMLEHIRKRAIYPKLEHPVFSSFYPKNSLSCVLEAQNLAYKLLESTVQNIIKSCQAGQLLKTIYIADANLTKTEKESLSNKYKNIVAINWISTSQLTKTVLYHDSAHFIWFVPGNLLHTHATSFPTSLYSCITYLKRSQANGSLIAHASLPTLLNTKRPLASGVYGLDKDLAQAVSHNCSFIITKKFLQSQKILELSLDKLSSINNTFWLYYSYDQAKKPLFQTQLYGRNKKHD